MLIYLISPITADQIAQSSQDLQGYIKFVVDINQKIATVGGLRHYEGEQLLLSKGSNQADLWGGGIDVSSHILDFESMINIRPTQNNPSREVLSPEVRQKITDILIKLNLWTN